MWSPGPRTRTRATLLPDMVRSPAGLAPNPLTVGVQVQSRSDSFLQHHNLEAALGFSVALLPRVRQLCLLGFHRKPPFTGKRVCELRLSHGRRADHSPGPDETKSVRRAGA